MTEEELISIANEQLASKGKATVYVSEAQFVGVIHNLADRLFPPRLCAGSANNKSEFLERSLRSKRTGFVGIYAAPEGNIDIFVEPKPAPTTTEKDQ